MKLKLACCALALAIAGCQTSSTGRSQVLLYSDAELNKMGSQSFEEMKANIPISKHQQTNQFVQCVADDITKNVSKSAHQGDWEVVVFDSPQINAFALPGGKIGVYTGILHVTENADQLAAIMGHEVAHVLEQHSNERLSQNQIANLGLAAVDTYMKAEGVDNQNLYMAGLSQGAQLLILLPYGRSHESEADIVGQDLMARSGYNPSAAIDLWHNMAKASGGGAPLEFMSTHPSNQTRISDLSDHLPTANQYYQQAPRSSCKKPNNIPTPKPMKK